MIRNLFSQDGPMKKETKKRYDEFVNNYFLHHMNLCEAYMATYPKVPGKQPIIPDLE